MTYFNDGEGGGLIDWSRSKLFFGADILAKKDFLGSMKDARICFGSWKNKTEVIFLGCEKTIKGFFWGMLKKVVIFLGRQILKLWFFWV